MYVFIIYNYTNSKTTLEIELYPYINASLYLLTCMRVAVPVNSLHINCNTVIGLLIITHF